MIRPPEARLLVRRLVLASALAGALAAPALPAPAQSAPPTSHAGRSSPEHLRDIELRLRLIDHQERVDRVAQKLLAALPSSFHPDSSRYLGIRIADHEARANDLMAEALGLTHPSRPFVYSVDPTGPAAEAGIKPGDQIVALAEKPVLTAKQFHQLAGSDRLGSPVRVRVLRRNELNLFDLEAAYRPRQLEVTVRGDGQTVNAYVDRNGIVLTTGMLNFLESDDELAVVLGHEIAHLLRGHFSSSYRLGYSLSFSRDLEREADRYGLDLAHRAGYDPEAGVEVWKRFALELPKAFTNELLLTHPTSRERIGIARKVAERLKTGRDG